MANEMSSRERMLAALNCERPDHVPLAFMIFSALNQRLNRPRMEAFLDFGVDLFIRRAWYEGTDFWSPGLYRQFFLSIIGEEVRMAHEAGAKFGYIMTTSTMPLLDILLESGIDVLIGIDPVQGRDTDLAEIKQKLNGKMIKLC